MRCGRASFEPDESSHIVLTYVEHKLIVIDSSHILREYWRCLVDAFSESEKVVLFGYSGADKHLNEKINQHCSRKSGKRIVVIEWEGSGSFEQRQAFWQRDLGDVDIQLQHLKNPLEFNGWSML